MVDEGIPRGQAMTRSGGARYAKPARHPGRWIAGTVMLVLLAMLGHLLYAQPGFEWHTVWHYLFNSSVLVGVLRTVELTAICMSIGIAGGIVLAVMRLSDNPVLRWPSGAFIWFFRGTPLLVQLLFWYYIAAVLPRIGIGIPFGPEFASTSANSLITKFLAAILGLAVNECAYMAEIVRGGILGVDPGQTEAARALGYTTVRAMRRVVLPQAMRIIIPPTGNEAISMLKNTSLVLVIAYSELLTSVQKIYSVTFQTIPLLIVACIWYLVITSVMTAGQRRLEARFARGSAHATARRSMLTRLLTGSSLVPTLLNEGRNIAKVHSRTR